MPHVPRACSKCPNVLWIFGAAVRRNALARVAKSRRKVSQRNWQLLDQVAVPTGTAHGNAPAVSKQFAARHTRAPTPDIPKRAVRESTKGNARLCLEDGACQNRKILKHFSRQRARDFIAPSISKWIPLAITCRRTPYVVTQNMACTIRRQFLHANFHSSES